MAYQVENRDLHHTLIEVCGAVFHDFDSHDFLSFEVLAFDDLPESTLPKDIKDQIAVLMTIVFIAKDIIHVEDIITVLIIIPIVFDALAGFSKNAPRIPGRLIFELWIANAIGGR